MQKIKDAAPEFLANKRVAVTGVSRHAKDHGSNVVNKRLRDRGYHMYAVNPNADEVEGDRCIHDLCSIPDGVDAVVIATRPRGRRGHDARVCRTRHPTRADAPWPRYWERFAGGSRLRPAAGQRRDRRRLSVHVRSDRGFRAYGDAGCFRPERERPEGGLTRWRPAAHTADVIRAPLFLGVLSMVVGGADSQPPLQLPQRRLRHYFFYHVGSIVAPAYTNADERQ
jgi:CoA binding domain